MDDTKKTTEDLHKVLSGEKKKKTATEKGSSEEQALEELVALQGKLKEAESESQKNHEKLLRTLAEFENYKKRVARDHEERIKYSHENLIRELLPVLDDLDRVLDHLPKETTDEIKSLVEGVQLIQRHCLKALKHFSLEEVKTEKVPFDPHLHEALSQVESNDHKSGEIVACHRKGYRLHGRLIRPALVTVAKEGGNNGKKEEES